MLHNLCKFCIRFSILALFLLDNSRRRQVFRPEVIQCLVYHDLTACESVELCILLCMVSVAILLLLEVIALILLAVWPREGDRLDDFFEADGQHLRRYLLTDLMVMSGAVRLHHRHRLAVDLRVCNHRVYEKNFIFFLVYPPPPVCQDFLLQWTKTGLSDRATCPRTATSYAACG